MKDIKVGVARLHRLDGNGSLKAFADVVIEDSFLIKGMRIVEGKKGLFVGLPGELGKNGKWYNSVEPITDEAKSALAGMLLETYASGE